MNHRLPIVSCISFFYGPCRTSLRRKHSCCQGVTDLRILFRCYMALSCADHARLHVFLSYVGCFDENPSYDRGCVCCVCYWHSVQKRQYILLGLCESFSLPACLEVSRASSPYHVLVSGIVMHERRLCVGHA